MLDPASAIGLASSVVQLVTFTKDVLSRSHELYESVNGATVEYGDIEKVTSSLDRLMKNIELNSIAKSSPNTQADEVELELKELCLGVKRSVDPLLDTLRVLKLKKYKSKTYESVRVAIKTMIKEPEIDKLEHRLDRYRKQLDTTLLVSLR